jgi:diaminopimelate decarboxylase
MLEYRRGHLFIDNAKIADLAAKYGTPLFVYSKSKILNNFQSFDNAFRSVNRLVCYAVKANSNYTVLKLLAEEGAGADITSGGELFRALRAGFSPEKIVYAGIGKTGEEIAYALDRKILIFNVESFEELELINRTAVARKVRARIAFRVNPDVDAHTHRHITTGRSDSKFGIPFGEAITAYKTAKKLKGIEVAGIHCHIGSQITSVTPFHLAALKIKSLVDKLREQGISLSYVNMGGGLGIKYHDESPDTPEDLAKAVLPVFGDHTFIFEPGRYIIGNTCALVTKIIYRKRALNKNFLVVDAGMNDLIRPTLYDAYHDIVPVFGPKRACARADVVGPICETGDFLGKDRLLPKAQQGEYLAVKCAGAYGFAMSSQYNSRLRAAEVIIEDGRASVIRNRERYDDLVAKETGE